MTSITLTIIIIAITAIVSFIAFSNEKVMNDLIFYPPAVTNHKQWWRFITCGFIHADVQHLAFNMISLYFFGRVLEYYFVNEIFLEKGKLIYAVLYFTALAVCILPSYFKNKNNYHYRSLGASGAVSAIVFASIMLAPLSPINMMFIPIDIPGIVFGVVYLIASAYMEKKGGGNINHSAHIWGAIYGIVFVVATSYIFSDFNILEHFYNSIRYWKQ